MKSNGQDFLIFAVKDELTGKFLQPIFMETSEEAIRWFTFVLNNTELWKANAAMYSLYLLGGFNDRNGLKDYPTVELVQGGLSVLKEDK